MSHPSHYSPRPTRPAFTLIELLVVISIIALLIAILLPVLGTARDAAKAAMCLSNQRQLGLATYTYTNDYKGAFPQPARDGHLASAVSSAAADGAVWFNALDYYLQLQAKSYASASERNYEAYKQDPAWQDFPEDGNVRRDSRTIKMNQAFGYINNPGPSAGYHFYRETEIDTPLPETVMYLDGRAYDTPSTSGNTGGSSDFQAVPTTVGLRHDNAANVTFVDGHAALVRDPWYLNGSGYQAWFYGEPTTNGYTGSTNPGPHSLKWFFDRGLHN